ncbi:MAG: AtpZ/AtpI family protein [Lachnospiraceae bacterium]|nr:AtpZ/AtpI family protein [Lachnospiraceae bacterium]
MKDNRSVGKSLTMISQVSISMLVPIFLCCMLGMFLEDKFGWPAFIPLFILGALAGMRNVYVLLSSIYKEDDKKKNG